MVDVSVLDELAGAAEVSGELLDDGDEEPMVDDDGDELELVSLLVDGVGVVIVGLVSVVGAAGGSDFLQAPSAAKAAARATHLIELRMFTPTGIGGQCRDGARPVVATASVIDGTACRHCPKEPKPVRDAAPVPQLDR